MTDEQILALTRQFLAGQTLLEIEPLGSAGGFSGAQLWRIESPAGQFCLRQWPKEHPHRERLAWIHRVLLKAGDEGLCFVPVPLRSVRGETALTVGGRFVELTPWMPGTANYWTDPSRVKLEQAMIALAKFHLACASMADPRPMVSPGINDRAGQLRNWIDHEASILEQAIQAPIWPELSSLPGQVLHFFNLHAQQILDELNGFVKLPTLIQPCIRDVWHDHVLFEGDRVSGIVDYGALNRESPMADVARLLGSLVADDSEMWTFGTDAYRQIRQIGQNEMSLIGRFDRSNSLLAPMNWLRWIYREGRQFDDRPAIVERMRKSVQRMENLGRVSSENWPIEF